MRTFNVRLAAILLAGTTVITVRAVANMFRAQALVSGQSIKAKTHRPKTVRTPKSLKPNHKLKQASTDSQKSFSFLSNPRSILVSHVSPLMLSLAVMYNPKDTPRN